VNGAIQLLTSRPVVTTAGLLAAALLLWFVGPVVRVGDFSPLASDFTRWIGVAVLLGAAAAYVGSRAWRASQNNRRLMEGLLGGGGAPAPLPRGAAGAAAGGGAPGAHDLAVIGKRFEEAIALLKSHRVGGKRATRPLLAALAGRPLVYELPWYIIIGAPGAGKTTALVNSGLEFPLAEKLGRKVLRGIGGTRNCDWWFANDAVLVDTAGRFTTQDSDRAADRAAWVGFLELLVKYRPRRPINGVLLTISVSDLLTASAEERQIHARKLRERIDELHAHLGIAFPIYVMITKMDLLAGFMEFFADFDKDERSQVWGVTFPYGPADAGAAPLARMAGELAALEKRLDECLFERLQAERDRERRAAIYAFPQQWRVLRETLLGFLQNTFAAGLAPGAAAAGGATPLVRGVYFTSATQEGTPMDRALGGLARALGLSNRLVAPARPSGKTFFVTRLLRDVVFAEAGLAGTNLKWERGRALLQWVAVGVTAVVVVAGLALSWRAYADNRDYVAAVATRIEPLERHLAVARNSPRTDIVALLPALDSLHALGRPQPVRALAAAGAAVTDAADPEGSETSRRAWPDMGLDQAAMFNAAAEDAYRRLLKESFLPRIAARLEDRLRIGGDDHVELIYDALRAYIMLFSGRNFDAAALRAYLQADWDTTLPPTTSAADREGLRRHLDRLLAGGEVGAPSQADRGLIDKARAQVARVPLAQRVYNRLRGIDPGPNTKPFSVDAVAGGQAKALFARASGASLAHGVPALYSRNVYLQSFRARTQDVLRQFAAEQGWVLGLSGVAAEPPVLTPRLYEEIEQLYLADYVRVWDTFLRDLRFVPVPTLARTAELAQQLGRPDSALATLLAAAATELTLAGRPGAPPAAAGQDTTAASVVDGRFEPLRRYVSGQPSPLQDLLGQFAKLSTFAAAVDDAARRRTAPPESDVTRELAAQAARAPEVVRGMLVQFIATSGGQLFAALRDPLARQLAADVTAPCKQVVEGRYPLVRSARDEVSREDFARLFAAGGVIDGFFQRNLASFVDTGARPWSVRRPDGRAEPIDAALQFQRAQAIRDAFFREGRRLGVRLEFRLLEMDPGLTAFTLDVDGQVMRFARDSRAPVSVQWPGPAAPSGQGRVHVGVATPGGAVGSGFTFEGPWALFRLFDRVRVEPGPSADRVLMLFDVEGRRARFEVRSAGPVNPVRLADLEQFTCPQRL
jgi:type VI secretion system protein ImpL